MNEQIKTAMAAAKAFYEAEQALDEAKTSLEPYAKKQIEITCRVVSELGLKEDYKYRPYFYHDWIELEVGSHYRGDSEIPVINCNMWYRGRCGDHDSIEGSFELSQHILNDEPEKFEAELRAKLETHSQKLSREKAEQKQREIARLQKELEELQK